MVPAVRRGFTLHELIVSLTVMSGILVIAAHFSTKQLGFLRAMASAATVRRQLAETAGIAASLLVNVHPAAGDILQAQDTLLEFRLTTALGVTCRATPGRLVIPATSPENEALAAFADPPKAGDRMDALLADSTGVTWLSFQVQGADGSTEGCGAIPGAVGTLTLALAEPIALAERTPLRFTRAFRLSHYRSSDGKWYLGGRDWNAVDNRFNTVQPLAGPLRGRDNGSSGLTFRYADARGVALIPPFDPRQVAAISIVVRSPLSAVPGGDAVEDSAVVVVALRR